MPDICNCGHDETWHIFSDGPIRRVCVNSPCNCGGYEVKK